jgi:hypothetical protein
MNLEVLECYKTPVLMIPYMPKLKDMRYDKSKQHVRMMPPPR